MSRLFGSMSRTADLATPGGAIQKIVARSTDEGNSRSTNQDYQAVDQMRERDMVDLGSEKGKRRRILRVRRF